MTDRPILFSAPMIRALLEGRKTQTRRVLKPQPKTVAGLPVGLLWVDGEIVPRITIGRVLTAQRLPYAPGDRLWVKETWQPKSWDEYGAVSVHYPADGATLWRDPGVDDEESEKWTERFCGEMEALGVEVLDTGYYPPDPPLKLRPSIHMPRWASRLTLIVTDVRVQRIQDIGDDDAIAEGVVRAIGPAARAAVDDEDVVWLAPGTRQGFGPRPNDPQWGPSPAFAFRLLWESLNAKRGYGWGENLWVAALTFKVHKTNIDEMEAA